MNKLPSNFRSADFSWLERFRAVVEEAVVIFVMQEDFLSEPV